MADGSSICGYELAAKGDVEEATDSMIKASETLAALAGMQNELRLFPAMKEAVFFLDDGQWHLGWWTDGETVFQTEWFERNPPDIDGILGR